MVATIPRSSSLIAPDGDIRRLRVPQRPPSATIDADCVTRERPLPGRGTSAGVVGFDRRTPLFRSATADRRRRTGDRTPSRRQFGGSSRRFPRTAPAALTETATSSDSLPRAVAAASAISSLPFPVSSTMTNSRRIADFTTGRHEKPLTGPVNREFRRLTCGNEIAGRRAISPSVIVPSVREDFENDP